MAGTIFCRHSRHEYSEEDLVDWRYDVELDEERESQFYFLIPLSQLWLLLFCDCCCYLPPSATTLPSVVTGPWSLTHLLRGNVW